MRQSIYAVDILKDGGISTMNKLMNIEQKIERTVVTGYKAIENTVVSGYKLVENTAVKGYKKIEDGFVNAFLTDSKEDEGTGDSE